MLGTLRYLQFASANCSGEPSDTSSFPISFKSDFTDFTGIGLHRLQDQCRDDQGGTSAFQLCNGTTYRRRAFATANCSGAYSDSEMIADGTAWHVPSAMISPSLYAPEQLAVANSRRLYVVPLQSWNADVPF